MRNPSSLEHVVRCPRCERNSGRQDVEAMRGIVTCDQNRCGQHWWVMWLNAGPVEPQLAAVFGPELARANMVTWQLPRTLACGAFWQLSLSRNVYQEIGRSGSHRLLESLVSVFRERNSNTSNGIQRAPAIAPASAHP